MPKSEGSLRCHCGNFSVTVRECDLSLANLWEPFLQYSHIRNRVAQQNASRCLNWCVRHSRHYFFPPSALQTAESYKSRHVPPRVPPPKACCKAFWETWQDQERVVRDGVGELCHVCFLWSRSKDVSAAVTVEQHILFPYHFSRRWCQIRSNVDKKLWINRQTKSFEAVQLTCITAAQDIAAESSSRNRRFWHNIWLVLRVMDSLP